MKRILAVCAVALLLAPWSDLTAQERGATPPARGTTPPATPATRGRATTPAPAATPQKSPGAGPLIVFETATKGTFTMETYPNEAPKSVAHILALVKKNFYNGQRFHRVVPGFVVQWGDPQSRDFTKKDQWGRGGSGTPIGVAEINPKRTHRLGAVALAHAGDASRADSQIYVTLAPTPRLDGDYAVIGQVIDGMDVVQKLQVGDVIRRATVK
jgi:cyclophilin family peptidyl-prolyl cis-trans isomerase